MPTQAWDMAPSELPNRQSLTHGRRGVSPILDIPRRFGENATRVFQHEWDIGGKSVGYTPWLVARETIRAKHRIEDALPWKNKNVLGTAD